MPSGLVGLQDVPLTLRAPSPDEVRWERLAESLLLLLWDGEAGPTTPGLAWGVCYEWMDGVCVSTGKGAHGAARAFDSSVAADGVEGAAGEGEAAAA